jgi:hypothetical protein
MGNFKAIKDFLTLNLLGGVMSRKIPKHSSSVEVTFKHLFFPYLSIDYCPYWQGVFSYFYRMFD